jgi:rhodanese-related sulfurtransferase
MSSTLQYPVLSKRQLAEILHPFVIDARKSEDVVEPPPSEIVPRFRINGGNVPREYVHISFDAATKTLLASEESKLPSDKDTPIIVLCYHGNWASLMCELLTKMGYNNLFNGKNLAYLQAAFSPDGNMTLRQMFDRESCTYTYLLMDNATKSAVLIDPAIKALDNEEEIRSVIIDLSPVNRIDLSGLHMLSDIEDKLKNGYYFIIILK